MKDVVLPALGVILPIVAIPAILLGLYYLGRIIRQIIVGFVVLRTLRTLKLAPKPADDQWGWVDEAIEEFNQSLKDW